LPDSLFGDFQQSAAVQQSPFNAFGAQPTAPVQAQMTTQQNAQMQNLLNMLTQPQQPTASLQPGGGAAQQDAFGGFQTAG